jgi:uncharacterized protein
MTYSLDSAVKYGAGWKIEIVLKIAESCNLACDYCYFYFRGDESFNEHSKIMSRQTADDFSKFLDRILQQADFNLLQIDFHGGEPLLFPKARFDALCTELRQTVGNRADLGFALQTNGTLIDDEWIALFAKHDVAVGVSIDSNRQVHDTRRPDKKGRGSYDKALRGIELLKAGHVSGALRHAPAILCVYDFSSPIDAMFGNFVNEVGVTSFNVLVDDVCHDTFVRREGAEPRIYSRMQELAGDREDIHIDSLWRAERQLRRRTHDEELWRYDVLRQVLVTISSDGDIGCVDQARVLSDRFAYDGLHVATADLVDILNAPAQVELRLAGQQIPDACGECCWRYVCRGGDPIHRFSAERGFNNPSVYCDVLQDLYSATAAKLLRKGANIAQIEGALGIPAEEARQ